MGKNYFLISRERFEINWIRKALLNRWFPTVQMSFPDLSYLFSFSRYLGFDLGHFFSFFSKIFKFWSKIIFLISRERFEINWIRKALLNRRISTVQMSFPDLSYLFSFSRYLGFDLGHFFSFFSKIFKFWSKIIFLISRERFEINWIRKALLNRRISTVQMSFPDLSYLFSFSRYLGFDLGHFLSFFSKILKLWAKIIF